MRKSAVIVVAGETMRIGWSFRLREVFDCFRISHGSGAGHHVLSVDIELTGDARLGLVLSECKHAQARYQDNRWVWIAQCRRTGFSAGIVVCGVIYAILARGVRDLRL